MTTKKATSLATRYLRDQAKIMKKYGETAKLSGKRYDSAVKNVARTFETMSASK